MSSTLEGTPNHARAEALAADPRAVEAATRAFFALAERWKLSGDEARRLLAAPSERTYHGWKSGKVGRLGPDGLVRISYLLGIAAFLDRLFAGAPERAAAWMKCPNQSALTGGRSALAFVLDGGVVALDALHGSLQAEVGGGSPVTTLAAVPAGRR